MRILLIVAVISVAVPDRPGSTKKPDKPVQEQLIGEWQVTKVLRGGVDDRGGRQDEALIFDKDTIQVRESGKIQPHEYANYHIDVTRSPIQIDLDFVLHQRKIPLKGILKLDGDELTICITLAEKRPLNFESTADSQTVLFHLRRAKR